ncbi:MAG TPA: tetratricopeptide repeat protein [Candidatus Angelobacter sp.]|nr:tetratricopeptide repeat protein [Candidatus Angelobacter sp.]
MVPTRIQIIIIALLLAVMPAAAEHQTGGMQMSTKSAKARAFFEEGLAKMETLHIQAGLQNWRDAAQADPDFALPHIFLAYFAQDPTEQVAEREKALASRQSAGPEEQLIIDWLANGGNGKMVPAIQAMNEALEQYKQDKHLAWLAGWWLMLAQDEPGRAIPMFERAIKLDSKFADPWNEAAYCYARVGNYDKAFIHIKKYAEMLPHEANPQDSYAELSRMAGRYDDALTHYRMSLKLDPTFIESQLGLGDTYALMGNEAKARAEYAIGIQKGTKVQGVLWSLQFAATYVREGKPGDADAAFQAAAAQAHADDFANLEAEAYRSMALYQKNGAASVELLKKAEGALGESHKVPQALLDQELASILRTGVDLALQNGDMDAVGANLKRLQDLASSNPDSVIQASFHGASGAVLVSQGKYEDAISQLEEDQRSPFSLRGLAVAYEKTGDKDKAARITARLAGFNEPLIEQAIVVLPFRETHTVAKLGAGSH